MLADARSDPASTGVRCTLVSNQLHRGIKNYEDNFDQFYTAPGSGSARLPLPEGINAEDLKAVLHLQAEIDTQLGLACYSTGVPIGRKVQRSVLDFLDGVEPALRRAFELDRVEDGVKKRTRGLFETKANRTKRAKLMAKSSSLSEIG